MSESNSKDIVVKADRIRNATDDVYFVKKVFYHGQMEYKIWGWVSDMEIMLFATCYKPLVAEGICKKMNMMGSNLSE